MHVEQTPSTISAERIDGSLDGKGGARRANQHTPTTTATNPDTDKKMASSLSLLSHRVALASVAETFKGIADDPSAESTIQSNGRKHTVSLSCVMREAASPLRVAGNVDGKGDVQSPPPVLAFLPNPHDNDGSAVALAEGGNSDATSGRSRSRSVSVVRFHGTSTGASGTGTTDKKVVERPRRLSVYSADGGPVRSSISGGAQDTHGVARSPSTFATSVPPDLTTVAAGLVAAPSSDTHQGQHEEEEILLPFLDRPTEVNELIFAPEEGTLHRALPNRVLRERLKVMFPTSFVSRATSGPRKQEDPQDEWTAVETLLNVPREHMSDRVWLGKWKLMIKPRSDEVWARFKSAVGAEGIDEKDLWGEEQQMIIRDNDDVEMEEEELHGGKLDAGSALTIENLKNLKEQQGRETKRRSRRESFVKSYGDWDVIHPSPQQEQFSSTVEHENGGDQGKAAVPITHQPQPQQHPSKKETDDSEPSRRRKSSEESRRHHHRSSDESSCNDGTCGMKRTIYGGRGDALSIEVASVSAPTSGGDCAGSSNHSSRRSSNDSAVTNDSGSVVQGLLPDGRTRHPAAIATAGGRQSPPQQKMETAREAFKLTHRLSDASAQKEEMERARAGVSFAKATHPQQLKPTSPPLQRSPVRKETLHGKKEALPKQDDKENDKEKSQLGVKDEVQLREHDYALVRACVFASV